MEYLIIKMFNVILTTDNKGGFGFENNIPWKFNIDSNFFKTITSNHTILPGINISENILIMGKNTWESMNKLPLPNRISYVITTKYKELSEANTNNKINFFPDFFSAYTTAINHIEADIWVIGGFKIFDEALRHWACNKVYWTKIEGEFNSDVFINMNQYKIQWKNTIFKRDLNLKDYKKYDLSFNEGEIIQGIEQKYLTTLYDIIINGEQRLTRNGITDSMFNKTINWNLEDGFPLLTTKKMFWKGIVEELLFFIRGDTDTSKLSKQGIRIWEGNTSKEFLDKLGLNYRVGEMGPMYGYQWRFFNKPYSSANLNDQGIDQFKKVIEEIKKNPYSRRLLMTDFNPTQVTQGVLYPCHSIVIQFYVQNGKLDCSMYQRSGDFFLGVPFNIASTSLLVYIVSQLTNLKPGIINLILGDYHIYQEHIEAAIEQIKRIPKKLPQIKIPDFKTLEEVEKSTWLDYELIGYESYPPIKVKMIA
jgi:dihydrofolate reductase/thymidylate synthase